MNFCGERGQTRIFIIGTLKVKGKSILDKLLKYKRIQEFRVSPKTRDSKEVWVLKRDIQKKKKFCDFQNSKTSWINWVFHEFHELLCKTKYFMEFYELFCVTWVFHEFHEELWKILIVHGFHEVFKNFFQILGPCEILLW